MSSTPAMKVKFREINLRRYKITPEDYQRMYYAQDGLCKICRQPETQGVVNASGGRNLSVDHIHGRIPPVVRGLLCHRCNKVLGMVRDNADLLYAMARYLT